MSFGLTAPLSVPVEIRAGDRRAFRLSWFIGEAGIHLVRPVPFEIGRPVELRFALPDEAPSLAQRARLILMGDDEEAGGEAGACGLEFVNPDPEVRQLVTHYVLARLGISTL